MFDNHNKHVRSFFIKGLVLSMTLGAWFPSTTEAQTTPGIRTVAVGTTSLSPTPVFRNGGNTIVVTGSTGNLGLNLAKVRVA